MKKRIALLWVCILSVCVCACATADFALPAPTDPAQLPRVIITTDMEVDDANGILLTLMYANEMDLAGLVSTAGMWHFNGDGEHTLGEITPNYRCNVVDADKLTEFRPAEPDQIERFIRQFYTEDYTYLIQNNPNYPTPEKLLSCYAEGNVAFEGDVRFDTDGSNLIKAAMLDDDMRPLYIHHWGGSNTTCRALLSIYDEYHETVEWEAIRDKVVSKVVLVGEGEDYCIENTGVKELFPGLVFGGLNSFFSYPSYGAAAAESAPEYLKGPYLLDAFKRNHGQVLGDFALMDDGQVIYGEPMVAQYGLKNWVDWKELMPHYSNSSYLPHVPRWDFEPYDWMCVQFASEYIDIGLRQDIHNSGEHYVEIMFDELAARADWACMPAEQCNHAPIVSAEVTDIFAAPGECISLKGEAVDPDGDVLSVSWYVPDTACVYSAKKTEDGSMMPFAIPVEADGYSAQLTVPEDAVPGDLIVVNMEVQDHADRAMTRFAQFAITVE